MIIQEVLRFLKIQAGAGDAANAASATVASNLIRFGFKNHVQSYRNLSTIPNLTHKPLFYSFKKRSHYPYCAEMGRENIKFRLNSGKEKGQTYLVC